MQIVFLYTTCRDKDEAHTIASTLLLQKQIACANILPEIQSVFKWDDQIVDEEECAMILKTTADKSKAVIAEITRLHSYECPAVAAFNASQVYEKFGDWIYQTVNS